MSEGCFSPLLISFQLALDPPGATALTHYETGGVIASFWEINAQVEKQIACV